MIPKEFEQGIDIIIDNKDVKAIGDSNIISLIIDEALRQRPKIRPLRYLDDKNYDTHNNQDIQRIHIGWCPFYNRIYIESDAHDTYETLENIKL